MRTIKTKPICIVVSKLFTKKEIREIEKTCNKIYNNCTKKRTKSI